MTFNAQFRLLLTALATSSAGDWIYNVALLAFVAERGGAGWLGIVTAARVLPIVLLGPLGGVLADRCNRRTLMIGADLVRMALMAALALVATAGLPLWLAPLLAALATAAGSAQPACVSATTPRLVSAADLPRANAARSVVGQAAIVVGPAIGGLLLVVASPALAFLVNAATFAVSALATAAIRARFAFTPPPWGRVAAPDLAGELREGLDALRAVPDALRLVTADVACSFVYGAQTVLLVMVGHRLGEGGSAYGLLLAGYGLGGIAGALLAGRFAARWRRVLTAGLLALALPLPLLGLTSSLAVAIVLAFVGGAGGVVAEVVGDTGLQRLLPDAVLGRAFGLAIPASLSGIVMGGLVAGPLFALLGLVGALAALSAGVLALLAALMAPGLRLRAPRFA
jgi:MFS family permease